MAIDLAAPETPVTRDNRRTDASQTASSAVVVAEPALSQSSRARRLDWREPLLFWAVSRLIVAAALVAGAFVWPIWHDLRLANPHAGPTSNLSQYFRDYRARPADYGRTPFIGVRLGGAWSGLAPFVQWDAIWFQSVAEQGYMYYPGLKTQQNIMYFPGYPGLIWLAGQVGLPAPLAAVLLAHLATLATVVLFHRLVAKHFGPREARWVTLVWLFWPASLFGSCGYSDSLLALCCVLSLCDLLAGRLVRSGLWNGLATAVRAPGLALGFSLIPWVFTRKVGWAILGGLLSLTGILAFFSWHYQMSGDFLLYFHVAETWRSATEKTWNPIIWALIVVKDSLRAMQVVLAGKPSYVLYSSHLWEPFLATAAGLMLVLVYRLRNTGMLLSSVMMLAIPLSTGSLTSLGRYSWCNLPLFLATGVVLARSGWRWVWLAASAGLMVWLAIMHGGGWEVI